MMNNSFALLESVARCIGSVCTHQSMRNLSVCHIAVCHIHANRMIACCTAVSMWAKGCSPLHWTSVPLALSVFHRVTSWDVNCELDIFSVAVTVIACELPWPGCALSCHFCIIQLNLFHKTLIIFHLMPYVALTTLQVHKAFLPSQRIY